MQTKAVFPKTGNFDLNKLFKGVITQTQRTNYYYLSRRSNYKVYKFMDLKTGKLANPLQ